MLGPPKGAPDLYFDEKRTEGAVLGPDGVQFYQFLTLCGTGGGDILISFTIIDLFTGSRLFALIHDNAIPLSF